MKNKTIVICGPSGVGKTTLINYILEKYHANKIITHTTRPKRTGEIDGVDYYFESKESFATKNYLEEVTYANNQYGSSVEGIKKAHETSPLAVIILDTVGAIRYHKYFGDDVLVFFVTIKDKEQLIKRLIKRGDNENALKERINSSDFYRDMEVPKELKGYAKIIENDDLTTAQAQIDQIIKELK